MTATILKMILAYITAEDQFSKDNMEQLEAVIKVCSMLWSTTADERFSARYEIHDLDDARAFIFGNAVIDLGGGLTASLEFEVMPGYDRREFELAFLRNGALAAEPQRFGYGQAQAAADIIGIVRRSVGGGPAVFEEDYNHFTPEEE